jgi:1,4-alpha-glucan branching enzyme
MRISISQLNRMKRNTTRFRAPLMVEQVFSIDAPGALRVQLAGNFTRWEMYAISMSRGQDAIWRCKVDLAPGTITTASLWMANGATTRSALSGSRTNLERRT